MLYEYGKLTNKKLISFAVGPIQLKQKIFTIYSFIGEINYNKFRIIRKIQN